MIGIAAATIFIALLAWNEFLILVMLAGDYAKILLVDIVGFISARNLDWGARDPRHHADRAPDRGDPVPYGKRPEVRRDEAGSLAFREIGPGRSSMITDRLRRPASILALPQRGAVRPF
ncbi:MAG: hypothetical protein OEU92_19865 [Alphaproteobacteria bacterium]|nr:hypothetical protein [Alphaproteobacteria bacterium]